MSDRSTVLPIDAGTIPVRPYDVLTALDGNNGVRITWNTLNRNCNTYWPVTGCQVEILDGSSFNTNQIVNSLSTYTMATSYCNEWGRVFNNNVNEQMWLPPPSVCTIPTADLTGPVF